MYKFVLGLLLAAASTQAAQVVQVTTNGRFLAVSAQESAEWWKGEKVCVVRNRREIACGVVRTIRARGAVVELQMRHEFPRKGDLVRAGWRGIASADGGADAPGSLVARPHVDSGHRAVVEFSAGALFSAAYFIPTVRAEWRAFPAVSLGLQSGFFSTSTTNTRGHAIPLFLTLGLYPRKSFEGIWVQLGVGAYFFSISDGTTKESPSSEAAFTTIGYRFAPGKTFNVGIGAGVQYFPQPNSSLIALDTNALEPLIAFDFGLRF